MRVVLRAHSRQLVPRTVRLCGVARHAWPQEEHTQKTPILEPNVVVSGVRFPLRVGCHSPATAG